MTNEQKRIVGIFKRFLNNGGGKRYSAIQAYYRKLQNIGAAIKEACSFHNDEKTLEPHQYRIRKEAMKDFFNNVNNVKGAVSNCKNFKELYDLINKNRPKFIGELAVYDAALRIGAFCRKRIRLAISSRRRSICIEEPKWVQRS